MGKEELMTTTEGKKRKVLIVSFMFPPAAGMGVVRVSKFAKYLPQFGWKPVVLTVNRVEGPQPLPVEMDEASVIRTPYIALPAAIISRELYNDVFAPQHSLTENSRYKRIASRLIHLAHPIYDLSIFQALFTEPIGWYPYAVKKGREILSQHRIDAIFSTSEPFASHLVASRLQRDSGIPWVADFRDLWSLSPYHKTTKPLRFIERQVEKQVIKNSCLLVGVSEEIGQQLQRLHSKRTGVIYNGFDEQDYLEDIPLLPKFTITYTGSIYPEKRDPTVLFQALRELREEGRVSSDALEVRFFGSSSIATLFPLIRQYQLEDMVKIYGFVPFRESIRRQKESTVLLLLAWNAPFAKDTYTGKLFEYLGASRPILAIAYKGGTIDNLLHESGTGVLTDQVEMMKDILCHWLEEWAQWRKIISYWQPDESVIQRYTRRKQAERLAQLLDDVSSAAAGKKY